MSSSRRTGTNENVSTGGNNTRDYDLTNSELTNWEQATDNDLVTAEQSEVLEIYDDAASFDDYVTIGGATTSSSYFRIIRPADGEGHDGTPNNGVHFSSSGSIPIFQIYCDYFSLQDVILTLTYNSTHWRRTAWFGGDCDYGDMTGVIVANSNNSGSGGYSGFGMETDAGKTCYFINCLSYNVESQGFFQHSGTGYFYNCTSYSPGGYCFYQNGGTGVAKNCIAVDGSDGDWYGTWSKTTCTAEGASVTFVNAAGGDCHLSSGDSTAKDQGTDLSSDGTYAFDDDIDGDTRSGSWDIGFDEYVAAGPSMDMKVNVGGVWKDVEEVKINVGGAWKDVSEMKMNIGDAWKTVF
jgi:hypothetical protein